MVDRAIDHPLTPKRRWFLKTALAIGAIGASLGGLVYWHRGMADDKLTEHGRDVLRGLAIGMVGPMLPTEAKAREAALEAHLERIEMFMNGLPTFLRGEISAVLGLLGNLPTRKMLTGLGKRWGEASEAEIADAIETMRMNPLPSTRLTYQVVRSVTCMVFFTNPTNWPQAGYPGPVEL